jgi:hypothetical protein
MADIQAFHEFKEYIPALWFNADKTVSIELKCARVVELQEAVISQSSLSPEKVAEANRDFVAKHVGKIKGLTVDGVPVETFAQLLQNGPVELYSWINEVVYSSQRLSMVEVKN